jgi:cyclase
MIRKVWLIVILAAALMAALAGVSSAQAPSGDQAKKAPPPQAIQQIKPGLYVVTGAGGNTTVRVTPAGLIVVDSKNRGDNFYNELMGQIRTVSDQPVRYVVITHHHQDHSGNTQNFVDSGAQVIANEGEKTALANYNPPAGKPGAPTVTYANEYTIELGGVEARVYHWGGCHTTGDSIVYWPDLKVVSGGDCIVGTGPAPDYAGVIRASLVEWVKVLDEAAKLDFDTVVPGHSPQGSVLMTRADFDKFKANLDTLVSRGIGAAKQGVPKDQFLAAIKTDDLGPGWSVTTPAWTARLDNMYEDFKAAAK